MAGITFPYHRSTQQSQVLKHPDNTGSTADSRLQAHWLKLSAAASAIAIAGYFLLLGSIAVVTITGQFPWFIAAPIAIILAAGYLRYAEEREARRYRLKG